MIARNSVLAGTMSSKLPKGFSKSPLLMKESDPSDHDMSTPSLNTTDDQHSPNKILLVDHKTAA